MSKFNHVVSQKFNNLPALLPSMFAKQPAIDEEIVRFFFSRYQLVVANDEKDKDVSFKTRHKVYCEEMKFEQTRASSLEVDKYDDRAVNCYIKHLPTGECAGTIRLVLPQHGSGALPLEDKFSDAFSCSSLLPSNLVSDGVCEISRLAVPREFRVRQFKTKVLPSEKLAKVKQNKNLKFNIEQLPYLSIALYLMATSVCLHLNMSHAYVLMEPKLARRMKAFGIHFNEVGEAISFKGQRVPYRLSPTTLVSELSNTLKRFQQEVHQSIQPSLNKMSVDAFTSTANVPFVTKREERVSVAA
ncbi:MULTISPECIES: PEP-CTERM/exosortase system-associated acyltransferase [unclassified Alteromonas]|uniref:PEP-CTERM/exosortase system-associated acyltransferase n=1 Tax=unclassified Alteromonas TaxID=2614992 RepID=UPI000509EC12|nr:MULTISPECIES: PEP-CTERM/exosortase system-associated acyltransferase [unclassified Alteromonas]